MVQVRQGRVNFTTLSELSLSTINPWLYFLILVPPIVLSVQNMGQK
jgi:hypothetical protein